jgi:hypothetical protein
MAISDAIGEQFRAVPHRPQLASNAGQPYRDQRSSCLTSAATCGGMGVARASYWSLRHCPIADSPTLSRPSFGRLVAADARSIWRPLLWIDRFGIIQALRTALLSHPPPISHLLRKRGSKRKTEYGFVEGKNGFNCVSCGTFANADGSATPCVDLGVNWQKPRRCNLIAFHRREVP